MKYIKYLNPILVIAIGFIGIIIADKSDRSIERLVAILGCDILVILGLMWLDIKEMMK